MSDKHKLELVNGDDNKLGLVDYLNEHLDDDKKKDLGRILEMAKKFDTDTSNIKLVPSSLNKRYPQFSVNDWQSFWRNEYIHRFISGNYLSLSIPELVKMKETVMLKIDKQQKVTPQEIKIMLDSLTEVSKKLKEQSQGSQKVFVYGFIDPHYSPDPDFEEKFVLATSMFDNPDGKKWYLNKTESDNWVFSELNAHVFVNTGENKIFKEQVDKIIKTYYQKGILHKEYLK